MKTSTAAYLVWTGTHNTEFTCRATGPFGIQHKSVILLSYSNSSAVYGATVAVLLVLVAIAATVIVVVILAVKKYDIVIHTVM